MQWFNENQGFIMAVLTAIYVGATITIMYYNRKTIKEMQLVRFSNERPYVLAYFVYDENTESIYVVVKNFGKAIAKIKKIIISPTLEFMSQTTENFLEDVIIAPEQSFHFMLNSKYIEEYFRGKKNKVEFDLDVLYSSSLSNEKKKNLFNEKSKMNIQYIHDVTSTRTSQKDGMTKSEISLYNMERSIKTIATHIIK